VRRSGVAASLSSLNVTFTESKGRAFGVVGAIAGGGAGGAIGVIAGGVLFQYDSWRWCLLVTGFVVIELRSGSPLLPLRVVTERDRSSAFIAALLVSVAIVGMSLFFISYPQ
jgi:MFS family permease